MLAAACSDDFQPTYTVGAEHNAITLRAAIGSGEDEVASRAPDPSHGNHVAFNSGLLHLRVDGVWKGHEPEDVHKKTFGTVGYAYEGDILQPHNPLTLSPSIFWDDFGTADPANMTPVVGNGRDKGLRIFGVTVDGYADHSQSPPVFNILPNGEDANQGNNLMSFLDWTNVPWTLPLNQKDVTTYFDLLTSKEPPAHPERLPVSIALIISRSPDIYKPCVSCQIFPALGAHLKGVRVVYIDNVPHELGERKPKLPLGSAHPAVCSFFVHKKFSFPNRHIIDKC